MAEVTVESEEADAGVRPAAVPLTRHTAHGFAWMIGQTFVTKLTGIAGQIMMAWFLSPKDFGVVSLAYALASFPAVLRDAGLQSILIQRQKHIERWINPVFWMSAVLGVISCLVLIGMGPFARSHLHEPALFGLLFYLGLGSVASALATVPGALVQVELRFRFQAILSFVLVVLTTALNILMAWRGYGAYSFIVPAAIASWARTIVLWWAAAYPIRPTLELRRWRFLIGDSGIIFLTQLLIMVVSNGDYLILGARYRDEKQVVGQFYFAFNLSLQTLALVTVNLGGVLFPALARLSQEPIRQAFAFVRSMRLMAVIAIPACLLQAALAKPGMQLLFNPKWNPAIPILQVLSIAMAFHVVGFMYFNLTSAQRRLRLQLILSLLGSIFFLLFVAVASVMGKGLSVATAELLYFGLSDPFWLYIVLKKDLVNAFGEVAWIFLPPLIAGGVAIGAAMAVVRAFPTSKIWDIVQIATVVLVATGIYIPLIRVLAPAPWKELQALIGARAKTGATAS